MLQEKKIPSTIEAGDDYSDTDSLSEKTLVYLLPMFKELSPQTKRDLFDLFTMGMMSDNIFEKLKTFMEYNPRRARTIDELLEVIELYEAIESHYTAHLDDKKSKADRKLSSESPLRVLKYIMDLSKKVPEYVKDMISNQWFS